MKPFDGYMSHQLLVDQDEAGHIVALGKWRRRDDADSVRDKYKDSDIIGKLTPLLARPRDRWITVKTRHHPQLHRCNFEMGNIFPATSVLD